MNTTIEYHRTESRRLAAAARAHSAAVSDLLKQRRQHAAQLRTTGWRIAHIADLYRLTPERIRQLLTVETLSSGASQGGVA